jgi:uncharacterized protein (TIGR02646 family)
MRKLNRDVEPPAGLASYQHGRDNWGNGIPSKEHRDEIWEKLNAMQGERCAYCEATISLPNCHIEHFRQRSRHPRSTFDWRNLFGSCNRKDTCGHMKDSCGNYPHEVLIKPDEEDPEKFLVFTPNGSVQPRANLDAEDKNRAEQTIRIFGLEGALTQMRKAHTMGYLQTALDIAELAQECPEEDWLAILQDELLQTENLPFATAIKHVLTSQIE